VLSGRSSTIVYTFEWIIYLRYTMFSSKPTQFSYSSNTTCQSSLARMTTQITLDAELGTKYEDSGDSFYYPMLLEGATSNLQLERLEEDTAYLQPFGCLLVLEQRASMSLHSVKMHPRCLKQSAIQSQVSMNPQCCPLGRMHCHFSWNIVPHHYTRY
jgi:hypothetical protein